mmetsp:Transcript_10544/g.18651  ORF Transcript_10544/g.18651 Transcript_10544/m.18651 type:complete len:203 (+) Transcript_10544:7987-8595(+)
MRRGVETLLTRGLAIVVPVVIIVGRGDEARLPRVAPIGVAVALIKSEVDAHGPPWWDKPLVPRHAPLHVGVALIVAALRERHRGQAQDTVRTGTRAHRGGDEAELARAVAIDVAVVGPIARLDEAVLAGVLAIDVRVRRVNGQVGFHHVVLHGGRFRHGSEHLWGCHLALGSCTPTRGAAVRGPIGFPPRGLGLGSTAMAAV